jgi:phenylacetic acid degradation protein/carnitine operon protein CaiE
MTKNCPIFESILTLKKLSMFYSFKGFIPIVDPSSFVHPMAAVTGNVIIGRNCYIGPGALCAIGENCYRGWMQCSRKLCGSYVSRCNRFIKRSAHVGHGAIIHGATIGRNCLIGMNSVVMDNVELGDACIVGALAFVREGEKIPARSLLVGNPATVVKEVSDEMIAWKTKGTELYQGLPKELAESSKACEALHEMPGKRPKHSLQELG